MHPIAAPGALLRVIFSLCFGGKVNFEKQLKKQIEFIDRSCSLYDQGYKDESIRIAVAVRVILHDTNTSTSLLTHLSKKDSVRILSTIHAVRAPNLKDGTFCLSIPLWLSPAGVNPPLGKADRRDLLLVDDWLQETVIAQNTRSTRKDIILGAANQDGGAHVDANPNAKTKELIEGIGTLTVRRGNVATIQKLTDHHLPMLRQIGYEILNSPDIATIKT
jgi:hypothetical protein